MADCRAMSDLIDHEGFRTNVGIVLMRANGQVFLGRRTGGRGWQFPQGGVRDGEAPEEAVYRELQEEIGLTREDVTQLGTTTDWLRYRLPSRYVRRNQQPLCIGQKQRWFLFRMVREDTSFDFGQTSEPEFDRWRWVEYWEPVRAVIYFKRSVYSSALVQLASSAFPDGNPPRLPDWWDEITTSAENASRRSATGPR
jgi:putative (di)nucleoside polyphosphate hydrolase